MRTVVVIAAFFLSACANCPGELRPSASACPDVTPWTAQEQAELRKEYDQLPQDALLRRAVDDDLALRDWARACAAPGAHDVY